MSKVMIVCLKKYIVFTLFDYSNVNIYETMVFCGKPHILPTYKSASAMYYLVQLEFNHKGLSTYVFPRSQDIKEREFQK